MLDWLNIYDKTVLIEEDKFMALFEFQKYVTLTKFSLLSKFELRCRISIHKSGKIRLKTCGMRLNIFYLKIQYIKKLSYHITNGPGVP